MGWCGSGIDGLRWYGLGMRLGVAVAVAVAVGVAVGMAVAVGKAAYDGIAIVLGCLFV